VLSSASASNGCSAVTPIPSTGTYGRVAYKFNLNLQSPSDWNDLAIDLSTANRMQVSHIMCGSTINFISPPPVPSPLTPTAFPYWLGAEGSGFICYTDVAQPLHLIYG